MGTRGQGFKGSSEMLITEGSRIRVIGNADIISRGFRFEKGVSGTLEKDIAESERMLKALIKFLENRPLNP